MAMIDQIPSIVVCLRSGGDYYPGHVRALARQIERNATIPYRFVCYTDQVDELLEIETVELEKNYPGWWSCVELWKHQGPTIAIGLDTLVLKNIDDLLKMVCHIPEEDFFLLDSFFHPGEFINGMQAWNGDWSWLYDEFDFEKESKLHRGDENYQINALLTKGVDLTAIQEYFEGICSYKRHVRKGLVKDPGIIIFHGDPKPWRTNLWRLVE